MSKYQRWHDTLIERARGRLRSDGHERHHVWPRSLGGSDNESNIVCLSYREHFLVHWFLTKITTGLAQQKMMFALSRMRRTPTGKIMSSWRYALCKKIDRAVRSNEEYRKSLSEKVKRTLSDPQVLANRTAKILEFTSTLEYRLKMSEIQKKTHSTPEAKRNMSKGQKNRSPEGYRKASETQKRTCTDPVVRKRMSDGTRLTWSDPVVRRKRSSQLSIALKKYWSAKKKVG